MSDDSPQDQHAGQIRLMPWTELRNMTASQLKARMGVALFRYLTWERTGERPPHGQSPDEAYGIYALAMREAERRLRYGQRDSTGAGFAPEEQR